MKDLAKKVGKAALVVLGTAAIVAGGIWAAKELAADGESVTGEDTNADNTADTEAAGDVTGA